MNNEMLKPLKKFGKKAKIIALVLAIFLVSAGSAFFLMTREKWAKAAIGGTATISSTGVVFSYGGTTTRIYSVSGNAGTFEAMCVQPSKGVPAGTGTITEVSDSRSGYQSMVQIMILTDGRHEGGSATPWGGWMQSGYDSWVDILTQIAGSHSVTNENDAAFVVGHIMVGYLYNGDTNGVANVTALNNWITTINNYYAGNSMFSQMYKSYTMYVAIPDDSTKQTVGWIQYEAALAKVRVRKVDENGNGLAGATIVVGSWDGTDAYGGTSTTNSNGYTQYFSVPVGVAMSYYESAAPSGYQLNNNTYTYTPSSTGKQTATTAIPNTPIAKGGVSVQKTANYYNLGTGQTSLEGIQFGVYSNSSCTTLEHTLTLNSSGYAASGDLWYAGTTHYVKEIASTATSHGFVANTECKSFTVGSSGGTTALSFANNAIRGGIKITKTHSVYGGSNTAFAGVSFNIRNSSGTIVKTITTNASGVASTGATDLIFDTYTVEEVSGTVNQAFTAISNITGVGVSTNGTIVDLGTKNNDFKDHPSLSTVARNSNSTAASPSKDIEISETASITDAVSFGTTLQSNLSYRLVSTLYEVSSRTQVASATTSVSGGSSSVETVFSSFNSSNYIGKTLAVKQELQVQNNGSWLTLAVHNADLTDANETVKVKEIEIDTTALSERSSNNKTLLVGNVKVLDTVEITGLIKGRNYYVKGQLIDQSGNAITLTNGDSGDATTKTQSISYTGTTGAKYTMPAMEFSFDSSSYAGQNIVVYQTLYSSDGTTVLQTHKDATDADQTLRVLVPEISTTATNNGPGTETKMLNVGNTSVKDIVSYKYLAAGTTFVLKGELINKSTGARVGDVQSVSFTATGEEGTTSTTPMIFPVNTADLFVLGASEQPKLVVFEKLYRTTTSTTALATHEDLNDADQTVGIVTPTLETTATNNGSGDDEKMLNVGNTSVRDTVRFTGLVPGDTYTLTGTLRNLDNGAAVVSGPVTVTIAQSEIDADGSGENSAMVFELDTTLLFDYTKNEQAKLVVYEGLFFGDKQIGKHEDNDDAGQTVQIRVPEIQTKAVDKYGEEGKEQLIMVGDATVKDTIKYEGLVEGDWYMVMGTLMDPETGDILTIDNQFIRNSTTFKAGENGEGEVTVEINFDTTRYQGKHYVAFETLYRSQDKHGDGRVLAKHEDWNDEGQTVTVKVTKIGTIAKDGTGSEPDGDNVVMPEKDQVIVDTVSYEGVMREETYTLVGTLVDKETGEPILVNGEKITASTTFDSPSRKDYGEIEMTFTFDASEMPGQEIVVFEELYRGGSDGDLTAEHKDLEDANQYIKVRERIGTIAADYIDGDQKLGVGNAIIVDTVKYEGLKTGKSYVMVGTLMDKSSGEPVYLVQRCIEKPENTGEVNDGGDEGESEECFVSKSAVEIAQFTVGEEDATGGGETEGTTGTVKLYFGVNTRDLAGRKLVVFETLYTAEEYEKLVEGEDAEPVISHEDLEDEGQTVEVSKPRIATTAIDKIDDDKELSANSVVVVSDKVQYEGLIAGTKYKLKGVLMDKSTGRVVEFQEESETEQELEFVARGDSGIVELDFQINTEGMSGTEIVVFEKLYTEDVKTEDGEEFEVEETEIAEHEDINDNNQTVWVKVIADTPDTGLFSKQLEGAKKSGAVIAIVGIVILSTVGVVGVRVTRRKKFGF